MSISTQRHGRRLLPGSHCRYAVAGAAKGLLPCGFVALLAYLIAPACYGQPAAPTQPASPTKPSSDVVAPAAPQITAESLQQEKQKVVEAADLDEAVKTKAVNLYDEALARLEALQRYREQAAQYQQMRADLPSRLESLKKAAETPTEAVPLPAQATSSELQQRLTAAQDRLREAEKNLALLKEEPERRARRRAEVADRIEAIAEETRQIEKSLAAPPPPTDPPPVIEANRTLLNVRRAALEAELAALEQELPTYDATTELLKLETDAAQREVETLSEDVAALQKAISRARAQEAEKQAKEAEQAAENVHPALVELADQVRELADRRTGEEGLTARLEKISYQVDRVEADLKRIVQQQKEVNDNLQLPGMHQVLGPVLFEYLAQLPKPDVLRRRISRGKEELNSVRLQWSDVQQQRQSLADPQTELSAVVSRLSPKLDEAEKKETRQAAQNLLTQRRELLDSLIADYTAYFNLLNDLTARQQRLLVTAQSYREYLREHLLWIRSADVFTWNDVPQLASDVAWLLDWRKWVRVAQDLGRAISQNLGRMGLGVVLLTVMLLSQTTMRRHLRDLGKTAEKSYVAPYRTTLLALTLTLAISVIWPVLVLFLGWQLSDGTGSAPFSRAVGYGLIAAGQVYFLLELVRQLCRPQGLAESHFRWKKQRVRLVRRNARWFTLFALVAVTLIGLIEWEGQRDRVDTLGRVATMALTLAAAVFLARVLCRLHQGGEGVPEVETPLRKRVGYKLAVGVPLVLTLAAWIGFHYTTWQLCWRLVETGWLALVLLLVQAMAIRWLYFARGTIALEQARRKAEAAQLAQATNGEASSQDGPPVSELDVEEPAVDLATVNLQTRKMLRASLFVAAVVGLGTIWIEVLPGVGFLTEGRWSTTREVTEMVIGEDGEPTTRTVTRTQVINLLHVIGACLVCLLTFVAASNVPGLLEVLLLEHLRIDSGARYATSMLLRYVLILAGVFFACAMVGLNWSQVQWMVAGLSVGLGFGLQELFANFISGLILLFERPIRVGDIVTISDVSGIVTRIQIRATTVRNWDRQEFIVPNKELITGQLINWTLSDNINRVTIPIGVAYGSDTDRARNLLFEILRDNPKVLDDPEPLITFEGFGDSALDIVVRAYLPSMDVRLDAIHEVYTAIHKRFAEEGLEIAFPQRDIHLRNFPKSLERIFDRSRETIPSAD